MMGVPTFYTRLLKDPRLQPRHTRHMRVFISGSAPLLPETFREWQARTGHAIAGTLWHDRNQHEQLQSL